MPPLTHDTAPELVSGAAIPQQTRRVLVVRPFMFAGQAQEVDSEVDLPRGLAAEMLAAGKAAPVSTEAPAADEQPDGARAARPDKPVPTRPGRPSAA